LVGVADRRRAEDRVAGLERFEDPVGARIEREQAPRRVADEDVWITITFGSPIAFGSPNALATSATGAPAAA
jgi:hypothetical protein